MQMENVLYAGYSRVDITPDFSVPLAGYGNTRMRMSQGYVNRQYATCIAITDQDGKTVLLISCDIANAYTPEGKAVDNARNIAALKKILG